ncbi:MAG: Kielin/chordin-like protein [candidate division WS6 bacterium GW2011_GWE1_34_7]|uniref:Kielin/chordin-like protein n=1 Tax=candidate division WS6 bacterium GW2011_GWE1_34_7 TaxID=1619093 RepID=A0A0G0E8M3_9BACT|nr:MAG: Kielin/chordin-like protein [candidate division WS6 bacterium GW2011_GWE1_34_7]
MIEGISEVGSSSTEGTNISEISGGGDCSREKILNVVLLIMVFTLIGLFAYLFFSDRLIVGVENPLSNKETVIEEEESEEESESCLYNGVEYANGQGFPADDGCNSCSCTNGKVVCTLIACE